MAKAAKVANPLGRLKSFGLEHPWQATFFLPVGYEDLREPTMRFDRIVAEDGASILLRGKFAGCEHRNSGGTPRLVGYIADQSGSRIGFIEFGETRALQDLLRENANDLLLHGTVSRLDGRVWLKTISVIHPAWLGRIRPVYMGKTRVIAPEMARSRALECLRNPATLHASSWLVDTLGMPEAEILKFSGTRAPSLEKLLQKAHLPDSVEQGWRAQAGVERIAALGVARKGMRRKVIAGPARKFASFEKALKSVPFKLTEEQVSVVAGIIKSFTSGSRHVMLSGDVGTGKTVVYGAVVAAALAAGMRVCVLLPNQPLAEQIHRELTSYWPHYPCALVTGEASEKTDLSVVPLLIGTSALLFRDVGPRDLVVVDEQQKFARQQREQLLGADSMLLESTATCVPRTQALIQFGGVDVFRLRHCHVKKEIKTRIWAENDRGALFAEVKRTLADKGRILIVYPKRGADEEAPGEEKDAQQPPLPSSEEAFALWDGAFPGRVRLAHGGLDDAENLAAIRDLREGRADILVATSLVEVGITIPSLRRVLVVHAERFGLSTLHQIRGRVARDGGVGYCDLFLPRRVKDASFARMQVLARTTDGFEVSREDMRLRGFGDLSADSLKQTGADETFLFGRALSADVLDSVLQQIEVSSQCLP